ncbi:MAG: polysaccharide biosynthesis/export family protein [Odoribacter sp.]
MNKSLLLFFIGILLLTSCTTTKNISYFQDTVFDKSVQIDSNRYITLKAKDKILIIVSSKDPELAALFNLPRIQNEVGISNSQINTLNGGVSGYSVDSKGNIDFPVLGKLQVAGLNREEAAAMIKARLIESNLILDPVVTIDFMNLSFSLLGEVNHPGLFTINKDQITVLEAISMGGDLTVYGQRDKVMVAREDGGKRTVYKIDLRTSKAFESPAFYLQQNDVIYVEPNNMRANQATVNGNTVKSVSLWMSVASFLTTLSILIFN